MKGFQGVPIQAKEDVGLAYVIDKYDIRGVLAMII